MKEVIRKREPKDPFVRTKTFSVARNETVDRVLDKKRQKSWLKLWWRDYSLLVYILILFLGIIILARSTMSYAIC